METVTNAKCLLAKLDPEVKAIAEETQHLSSNINTLEQVRCFVEQHVFAVMDFAKLMAALKKRVNHDEYLIAAQLVNTIYDEEIHDNIGLQPWAVINFPTISHYELYHLAMRQVGADTTRIERFMFHAFLDKLDVATQTVPLDEHVKQFVATTATLLDAQLPALVAGFAIGREAITGVMFEPILQRLTQNEITQRQLAALAFYFKRHIDNDSESHLPQSLDMLDSVCRSPDDWVCAEKAARCSLEARLTFFKGINAKIISKKTDISTSSPIPLS